MHFRSLVPTLLALAVTTGCQSYFPNGYGYNGPYSSFPAGTYAPAGATGSRPSANSAQGAGQFPTPVGGQMKLDSNQTRGQSPKNSKPVPDYRSPDYRSPSDAPNDLGTPATEDELDPIKRGRSSRGNPTGATGSTGTTGDDSDDPEESLTSLDDEKFVSPTLYRTTAATTEDMEPRRLSARSRPSPYKKDPDGYAWLRGVVVRDPKTRAWRITYSRNGHDGDLYGGSLTLVDDESLDTLIDDDVVIVEGTVDESVPDRFGKPSYRVLRMQPLVPKEG